MRRRPIFAALVLLALALAPGRALAHAALLEATPSDGDALASAPSAATLRFSEPVAPVFVRLIDARGDTIADRGVRAAGAEITLSFPPALAAGGYLISYRVLSADSHPVGGAIAFSIGDAAATPAAPDVEPAERAWIAAKIALQFLALSALVIAAGATLFRVLVLGGLPHMTRMIRIAASVALLAVVLGVGVEGALIALAPGLFDAAVWRLGAATTIGAAAAATIPALLLLIAGAGAVGVAGRFAALAGAIAAPVSLALTGHAAAISWSAQLALALHALAATYWLGSLAPLLRVLRTAPPERAAATTRRFSTIALAAVALLVVSGIAGALARLTSIDALTDSWYGRVILLKAAGLVLLLGLAAFNHRRLTPRIAASETARRSLIRTTRGEIALGALVIAAATALANIPPPGFGAGAPAAHDHAAHEAPAGYAIWTTSRDYALMIQTSPARAGANQIELWLSRSNGDALTPRELAVELSLPAAGVEAIRRVPTRTDGVYRLTAPLAPAGRWRIRVEALISDFDQVVFDSEIPVR